MSNEYLTPDMGIILSGEEVGFYEYLRKKITTIRIPSDLIRYRKSRDLSKMYKYQFDIDNPMDICARDTIARMELFRVINSKPYKPESATLRFKINSLPLDPDHMGEDLIKFMNNLTKYYRKENYRTFVWINWEEKYLFLSVSEPDIEYVFLPDIYCEQFYGWIGDDIIIGNMDSIKVWFPELTFMGNKEKGK